MPTAEPNLSYLQEVLKAKAARIQPPDYWLTIRDAGFPNFGGDKILQLLGDGDESTFLRFWIRNIPLQGSRQRNNAELSPVARVITAMVFKGQHELQRQMAHGTADTINLMMGDGAHAHPEYAGENTWGLFTRQTQNTEMSWEYPELAGVNGVGIVWGSWDVEFRHPLPKG